MRQRNQASLDDFHGLSPERMHRILVSPFDSPELALPPGLGNLDERIFLGMPSGPHTPQDNSLCKEH